MEFAFGSKCRALHASWVEANVVHRPSLGIGTPEARPPRCPCPLQHSRSHHTHTHKHTHALRRSTARTVTPSHTQSHLEVHREVPTRHHEEVALGHATLLILCHRVGEGHRLPSVHLDIGQRACSTQQRRRSAFHGTCTMMGRSTPATGGLAKCLPLVPPRHGQQPRKHHPHPSARAHTPPHPLRLTSNVSMWDGWNAGMFTSPK